MLSSQSLSFLRCEAPSFAITATTDLASASPFPPPVFTTISTTTTTTTTTNKSPFPLCNSSHSSSPFGVFKFNNNKLRIQGITEARKPGIVSSLPLGSLNSEMSPCNAEQDPRIRDIKTKIRVVPNFPKPGIMFQDITTLLLDPHAFKNTVDLFVNRYKGQNISVVAGIEARGFIFGPPIALAIGAKFVPLRKPKKLPGEVISEEYVLEYGRDCIEMHVGAVERGERALVVDDLVATGGTLCAAMNLLERAGAEVVECACVIELPDLKGRERLKGKPLFILVEAH